MAHPGGSVVRPIVSCTLVASLLFWIGCYSSEVVSREEFRTEAGRVDVALLTTDSLQYRFSEGNYQIDGDSLTGAGFRSGHLSTDLVLNVRLSLANISAIEITRFDLLKTAALCGGVVAIGILCYAMITRQGSGPTTIVVVPQYQ